MDRHGSHSQRVPYARKEGRKSLFSKVKDSVKDMLSPSWLSDLVSNVKKETDLEATPTRQPEMNLNPAPGLPQSGVQQHAGAIPFHSQGLPLGNGQPRMMDFPGSRPAMAPGEGMSPFQQPIIPPPVSEFTSSQLPLARLTEKSDSVLANEDSVSQRSDASKSTSGCSSMIPQADARRRESGLEKRKAGETEIYSGGSSPPSPQDQPSKRQRLQVSINSSKTWTRGLGDSFSKPQAPAVANKPSFNTSLFGSPLVDDSSLLGTSFHDSSFYPGKTRYGGRASMSFRSKRNKVDLNQSLPARLSIPVKAFMKAKPKVNAAKEAVTSSTAKRILDALDKMPTPLNDAKKIPLAVPRHWTESPTFFSKDRQQPVARPGPPTQRLNISSLASISQNRQVATSPPARTPSRPASQSEVVARPLPSRDDTIILGGPGAPAAGSGKVRREKSYHRGSAAVTNRPAIQEEDTEILPNLATDFTLPVGSIGAMPKFNFGTPGATKAASSPPSKPALNFTFSSPIPENVPSNKPRSPATQGGFQFSSPISVDKQVASSSKQEPARSVTASSQPTQSQGKAPAPFSFGSPLNKSNNMDFTFSSAAAPKPKVTVNGPSTEIGSLKPASDLKQGSVMDILGGGSSAFGGVAPASQLKQGSVMDILGGSKPSDISSAAKSSAGSGFTGFQSTQSSAFGSNRSDSGSQQAASSTSAASSLPPLSSMVNTAGWSCDVCLVQNKAGDEKCVACQTAKPGPAKPKSAPAPLSQMFKQSGWTCDACLVQNKSDDSKCVACQSAKPGGSSQASQKLPPLSSMKTGGWTCDVCLVSNKQDSGTCVACQAAKPVASVPKAAASSGQNDLLAKFKPAAGQWECEVCLVRNKADVAACAACQTPKPLKSFRHPAGDWTCDTCLVVNKEASVKCVACSYARPGPPRTQTVPSCVKTFTQSANSGFTPSDSSKASNIVLEKGGGFKFVGGDDKGADKGGFKFGAVTSSVKTSEGSQSTGGFKLGDGAVSSSAAGGFQFGSSSDTKPQPAVGGFQFGTGKSTSDKQTSDNKLGGNGETSKPLAAGGFTFGAGASATQSNSISSESKSAVSTTNALPGGFSFGQSTESKPADPLKATTSVPGGFTFKPSDSVVSSAKTSEPSSQLTSPSVAPSIGGFNFSATSKPQNSLAASVAVTTVQSSAVTQNSVGGFTFTATKVTQSNSQTVPSQPSESKPVFGGFSFGSTSTNTSQSTTPAFGGYNFAQKPADSATKNTTSSQSLKRDRDDDSGPADAKKSLFAFGATTSANTATPFQFGATNNAATSSTASTSSSSGFAFGKQNSTPNFNFSAGKTDSAAPTPVFGAANTSSQVGQGTAGFGAAAAPTSTTPASTSSSMFVFGAQSSQQPTTAAAPAFGGFGSTSSFGAATGTTFGGNAPSTTPAFGATPPAFGSTNTSTAAPAFGGKTPTHVSKISPVLSSLSSSVSSFSPISTHCLGQDTPCSIINSNLVKTEKEKSVYSKETNLSASLCTYRKVRNQSVEDIAGTREQNVGLVKSHCDLSGSLSTDGRVRNQSVEDIARTREQDVGLVKSHHDLLASFGTDGKVGNRSLEDIAGTGEQDVGLVKSHCDLLAPLSTDRKVGNQSVEEVAGTGEQDVGLVKSHHDLLASFGTDGKVGNRSLEDIAGTGEQDVGLVKSHCDLLAPLSTDRKVGNQSVEEVAGTGEQDVGLVKSHHDLLASFGTDGKVGNRSLEDIAGTGEQNVGLVKSHCDLLAPLSTDRKVGNQSVEEVAGTGEQDVGLVKSHHDLLASFGTDGKVGNRSLEDIAGTGEQDVGLVKSHCDLSAPLSTDRKVGNQSVEEVAGTGEQDVGLVKSHHDPWEDFFAFDAGSDETDYITATVTVCGQSTSNSSIHNDLSSKSGLSCNSKDGVNYLDKQDCHTEMSNIDKSISANKITDEYVGSEDAVSEMRDAHCETSKLEHQSQSCQTEGDVAVCTNTQTTEEDNQGPTYREAEVQTVCFQSTQTSDTQLSQTDRRETADRQYRPLAGDDRLASIRIPSRLDDNNTNRLETESILKHLIGLSNLLFNQTNENANLRNRGLESANTNNQMLKNATPRVGIGLGPISEEDFYTQTGTSGDRNFVKPSSAAAPCSVMSLSSAPTSAAVPPIYILSSREASASTYCTIDGGPAPGSSLFTLPLSTSTPVTVPPRIGGPADVSLTWSPAGRKVMQSLDAAGLLTSGNSSLAASTTNQSHNVPGTAAFPSTPILGCSSSPAGLPSASETNSNLPNAELSIHSLSSVSALQGSVVYTSSASLSSLRCKTTWTSLSSCSATEAPDRKVHGSFTSGCRSNPCLTSLNRTSTEWPARPIYNPDIATSPFVSNCQSTVRTRTLTSSYPAFISSQSGLSSLHTSNNECFNNVIKTEQYRPTTSSLFNWQTPSCVSSARLFTPANANCSQPFVYYNQVTGPSMTTAEAEMDMDISNGSNDMSSTRAENHISNNVSQSEALGHDLHVFSAILDAGQTNILPSKAMVGLSGPAALFDPSSASPLGFGFGKNANSSFELQSRKSPGVSTIGSTNNSCEQRHKRNPGVFITGGTYSSDKQWNQRNPGMFTFGGAKSSCEQQSQRNPGVFTFGGAKSSCEQQNQRDSGVFTFGGAKNSCEQQNQRNPGVFTFGGAKSSCEQQNQRNPGVFTFRGTKSSCEQQSQRNPGVFTFGGAKSSCEQQNQRNPGVFTFRGTKSSCEQQSQRNPGVFTFGGASSTCEQQNQRDSGVFTFGGSNSSCEQQNQRNRGVFTFGGAKSSCEQQNERNPGVFTFGGSNSSCEQQNQRNRGVFTFGGAKSSCEQQNERNPGVFTFGGAKSLCDFRGAKSSCEQQNQRNPGVFTFGGTKSSCEFGSAKSSCEQQNQRNPGVFTFGGAKSSCEQQNQRNPGVFTFGGTKSSCEQQNQRNPGVFIFGGAKSSCEQQNQRNPGVFTFGGKKSTCEQNQRNPGVFTCGGAKSSCEQQNQRNPGVFTFGGTSSSYDQQNPKDPGVFIFGGTSSSFEQQNKIIPSVFAFGGTSHSIKQRNQSNLDMNAFGGIDSSFEQQNQKSAGVFTFGSRRSSCEKQNHRNSGLLAFGGKRSLCEQRSQRTSGLFAFGGTSSSCEEKDLRNSGLFAFGGRRSSCEQRTQRTSGLLAFGGTSISSEQRNQRNPGVYAFGGTSRSCEKPNQKRPVVFAFGGTSSSCDQHNKGNQSVFTFGGISQVNSSFTNSIVNCAMDTPAPNNKTGNHLMTEEGFLFSPQIQFKPVLSTYSCAPTCSTFCSAQSSVSYSITRSEPSLFASTPSAGPFSFSQPIFSGGNNLSGLLSEQFSCPKTFLSQSCLLDSDVEMEGCEEVSGAANWQPDSKAGMDKFVFSPTMTSSTNPNLHSPAAMFNETNEMVSAFMSTRVDSHNLESDKDPFDGACSNQGIFGGIKDFSESMECEVPDVTLVDKCKGDGKVVSFAKSREDLHLELGSKAADRISPVLLQNSEEGTSSVFQFTAEKQDLPFSWLNKTPDTAAEENKQASFYIDRKPASCLPDVPISIKNKTVSKLISEATEGPDISAIVARANRVAASPKAPTAEAAGVFVFSARSKRSTCSFNPKSSCCGATSDILRSVRSLSKPSAFSGMGKSYMSERVLEYVGSSRSDSSVSSDSSSSSSSCSPSSSDSSSARSSDSHNSLSSNSDTACNRREQPEPNCQDEDRDVIDEKEEKEEDDSNAFNIHVLRVDSNKRFGFLARKKHAKRKWNKSWNAVPAHIARKEEKLNRISNKIQQTNQPVTLPTGSCINHYWNVAPDVVYSKSLQRLGMNCSVKLAKLSASKAYSCCHQLSVRTYLLLGTDGLDPKCDGHHLKYFIDDLLIDFLLQADWPVGNNELRCHRLDHLMDGLQMSYRSSAHTDATTTDAAITDCKLCACAVCLLYFSLCLSGSGFNFKTETNNNATPAAPAQSNAIFQFGAKPAEASQPNAGFNLNPNPAGLGSQSSFNFGAGSAPGALSFSAQPTATPAGQPERRIKKAVRKIRR